MNIIPQWRKNMVDVEDYVLKAEAMKAPAWYMQDFIVAGGITLISGAPKVGYKTFISFCMAIALNTGRPFMGFKPLGKRKTLFLEAEGGIKVTANRWRSFANAVNEPLEDLTRGISWSHHPPDFSLATKKTQKELYEYIKESGTEVVFIDTLGMLAGAEENDNTAMNRIMVYLKTLAELNCSVVILHHVSKNSGEWDSGRMDDRVRGASAITGGYDVHLHVRVPDEQKAWEFVWEIRAKDGEFSYFKGSWWLESVKKKDGTKELFKTILDFESIEGLNVLSERDKDKYANLLCPTRTYKKNEFAEIWDVTRKEANKILSSLMEEGRIKYAKSKRIYYVT